MTVDAVRGLLRHVGSAAKANARSDLEAAVRISIQRLDRPETVVLVAGEFKQGKSSLINALIGVAACPVDDDLATAAVTVVRHGPKLEISVRRRADRRLVTEAIGADQLGDFVTERGNPGNERGVEAIDIRVPNRLLERGWAFIDTPGIGGLNAAQAAAALAFLPLAHALLFVSDASTELTDVELDFLARARETCPIVLLALSKTDLYPAWRRIEAADRAHLAARNLDPRIIPLSSVLRVAALARADPALNDESGIPRLLEALQGDVLEEARSGAVGRAINDGRRVIQRVRLPMEREAAALADPSRVAEMELELASARERLAILRGPAARWGQRLNDGFSELAASVDYRFRGVMRSTLRRAEDEIELVDPANGWDAMSVALQAGVATAVGEISADLVAGSRAIREELAQLIADDAVLSGEGSAPGLEVGDLWSGKPITQSGVKARVGMGFGALRGAQSGVFLLGMLGNLFSLAMIGPILLGGAAVFAGKSVLDERKRLLSQRRQEARVAVRQYVDDVQFEVGTRMRDLLRELQRDIRDDTAARLEELQRTYVDAATRLDAALKQDAATRARRGAELAEELKALAELDARLARLARPDEATTAARAGA
jgi:Dynamin family